MTPRLTVVLSQAQGKNPAKRALEESIIAALILESGLDVSVIPYLYDLDANHTGRMFLEGIKGDMCVLTWNFPRAAFWLLDRDGIRGHFGESKLKPPGLDDDDEDGEDEPEEQPAKGIGSVEVPERWIYCLDLRDFNNHDIYVEEIRRIAAECRERRAAATPKQTAKPTMVTLGTTLGINPTPVAGLSEAGHNTEAGSNQDPSFNGKPRFAPEELLKPADRRWYPVIDYSRCTNCLECLDFCLFGVYGVDKLDRINVENQDSCKKGCPACSRVCPEQAIMFPDYKTPAIAGAPVGAIGSLKIDLTKLFGGEIKDALGQAVLERDRELVADGRQAVGMAVGMPKRQTDKPQGPKDDLDNLMDQLDALDI